jgi:glucose-6-phosphate dehydrogenase assembly protein OpcA
MEAVVSENIGEPIPAGQAPHAWDELVMRFEQGFDLGRIQQLLQQARERGGQSQESVCTLNLVAIYFTAAQYEHARDALEAAGSLHPCRLVVLVADPTVPGESLTARVSVVRAAGAITLERVVLAATGRAVRHIESAMLGLLLPELPMVVVWGGRPQGDLLQRAVESADRIITDSGARPPTYLEETAQLVARGAPIGDLAWARIFPWQGLAADVLDLPNLREHRGNIQRARVVCAGAVGAEGLLLAGWMASRIKRLEVSVEAQGNAADFDAETTVTTAIPHAAPVCLGHVERLEFEAPPATFTLRRERGILVAEVKGDDDGAVVHRVRLPADEPGRLLGLELKLLAGVDELYAAAVQEGVKLLPADKA